MHMKKLIALLILACLFLATTAVAQEEIPARYTPILESWNATTAEELHLSILEYWKESATSGKHYFTKNLRPLSIRFGGETKELIDDKKNWDLAIVSSKEVDLQVLADEQLIMSYGYNPQAPIPLHQWLLPKNLQDLLPSDPLMYYYVYVYDYDVQTDDATFLICQENIGRKKNHPRDPVKFASEIMKRRSAESVRSLEGIRQVEAWTAEKLEKAADVDKTDNMHPIDAWTEKELIANVEEWDVAIIMMDTNDKLEMLDAAGLLFDFGQNSYFSSRTSTQRSSHTCVIPNGIFSADGRMIGIPCVVFMKSDDDTEGVLILNAKSHYIQQAHTYAVHLMKSMDWDWAAENKWWPHGMDVCMYKDEMDW